MALTVVEQQPSPLLRRSSKKGKDDEMQPPPAVAITPCDPWPQPYYLQDGLRRVAPYHFTYNTWCKARWRGREILDIFKDEFRDRPVEYYESAIATGAIHLNGHPVASPTTPVRNGDLISHTLHRHEPPVTAEPIRVVHESHDMLVISKPAGVPVHPAGRYNHNSVTAILRAERGPGFTPLPCNRLDRLTSGIMFVAKHRAAAERMTVQLTERSVRKEYVARVRGEFPEAEVVCDRPVLQISPKLGLNAVRASGKEARTVFRRVGYYPPSRRRESGGGEAVGEGNVDPATGRRRDGYSVVRCLPLTGRTHQIRVHLQFLGHPIANDPIYANARVFGPDLGVGNDNADGDESILERLGRMGKSEVAEAVAWHDEMVDDYERKKAEKLSGEVCDVCGTELYTDPSERELGIWLHAVKYEDAEGRWGYETGLPRWALPPEKQTGDDTENATSDGPKGVVGGDEVVADAKVIGDLGKALEETTLEDKQDKP